MTNEKIDQILADIFLLDPELKKKEPELRGLIEKLLAAKPEVEINQEFVRSLRAELLASQTEAKDPTAINLAFRFSHRLVYASAGALLCLLLLVPFYYWQGNGQTGKSLLSNHDTEAIFGSLNIAKVGNQAFGDIGAISVTNERQTASGLGGGGGALAAVPSQDNAAVSEKMAAPAGMGVSSLIAPEFVAYKYVYKGEELKLDDVSKQVLKRIKGQANSAELAKVIKNFDLGLVSLNNFDNLEVSSFSLLENRDYGYNIFVSFDDSAISISENWKTWHYDEQASNCQAEACLEAQRLKKEDWPEDEALIALANTFLQTYGVKLDSYGQPEVDRRWEIDYARMATAEEKSSYWIPEAATVIYPLQINGQPIYDEWGNKVSLSVSVNIKKMKVSGLYNLYAQNYQSSEYELEKDKAKILAVLEKGGLYGPAYYENAKTVEIEVGDPVIGGMRLYHQNGNESDELIVPALIFPIENKPEDGNIWQNSIAVPLAKDILDNTQPSGPILLKGAAEPAAVPIRAVDSAETAGQNNEIFSQNE